MGSPGPSVRARCDFLHLFRDLRSHNSRLVIQHARAHKAGVDVLEQLRGLWNILGTKPSVYGVIFSNFQA